MEAQSDCFRLRVDDIGVSTVYLSLLNYNETFKLVVVCSAHNAMMGGIKRQHVKGDSRLFHLDTPLLLLGEYTTAKVGGAFACALLNCTV